MSSEKLLNNKDVLENIDIRNASYYDTLTDEQKKEFSPFIIMKMASSVEDKSKLDTIYHYIKLANVVNINLWDPIMKSHQKLQWLLLSIVGCGKKVYHPWINVTNNRNNKSKIDLLIERRYPGINRMELKLLKKKLSKDDIIEIMHRFGMQDSDMNDIIKELEKL